MQSPTAEPRIPASASGVSTQRSGAEAVAETGRGPEDAAGAPDVLAEHDHGVVAVELDVQRVVDRLDEQQLTRGDRRRAHRSVQLGELVVATRAGGGVDVARARRRAPVRRRLGLGGR